MKIYEGCFGADVIRQIRKEMTAACRKCATMPEPAIILPPPNAAQGESPNPSQQQQPTSSSIKTQSQQSANIPASQRPGDSLLPLISSQPHEEATKLHNSNEIADSTNPLINPSTFDPEKLHQAVLAYRPNPFQQSPVPTQFHPYQGYTPQLYGGFAGNPTPFYPGVASPAFLPQFPGYPQYPNAFYPPQFYMNHNNRQRMSREMSLREQIDSVTNRFSGRVRNVTCVMQELGYLDDNLEPNYNKIIERISNLPIQPELKRDMQDSVTFCQKFSQCIPDFKRESSPLSRELVKPMFFFNCYKHKKLEACILKDIRDRFNQDSETSDFESLAESIRSDDNRQFRSAKSIKQENIDEAREHEQLSLELYEFLYGNNELDAMI
ncbi:uncharacterized protein LOC123306126 [Chrysoperla carnea]|uniref:uncharacterized protein LOC123306126 n=1 Tax=Chrysoperla carnea TaxID=189513 RepID=UPI001D08CB11|nr:uncharacterized protein LOC123306126 [Chrysoperla carnea]